MWFIEECGMAAVPWASLIHTDDVCEDVQGQDAELILHTNTEIYMIVRLQLGATTLIWLTWVSRWWLQVCVLHI